MGGKPRPDTHRLLGVAVLEGAGSPDVKQVDLTVVREQPDGTCTVRWTDPFRDAEREGPYRCTADRDPILKAPDPVTGFAWDTGFIVAEGSNKGDLYSLGQDDDVDEQLEASAGLLVAGVFLTIIGVVGGNIRTLFRMTGVNPEIVRRARRLRDAAVLVTFDHHSAVETVREAWTQTRSPEAPEVLSALRVLVETGPQGRKVVATARALTARLDPLLADAAPAAGRMQMLAASREERRRAEIAIGELRLTLSEPATRSVAEQFAQTSVDLLRGPDSDPAGLATRADFDSRPAEYRRVLADITAEPLT
ncbi:hypothetical protein [Streptomyces sp. NBC_00306]|uniref:hypothetical protein n=1 Tax=Streptomyces sp. NBC_00306 TaxID=2975708 RepID=UPI002E2CC48A|nr:hypothetical protein [Streptomyces sp. NBC_00306]